MKHDKLQQIIQEVIASQNKEQIIQNAISILSHITFPVNDDVLQKLSSDLQSVGIKPVDILASIGKQYDPNIQKQYLITGPSAPKGGGHGALQDLKNIIHKA